MIRINDYGDKLVEFDGNSPPKLSGKVIYMGYDSVPDLKMLYNSKKYGKLFATDETIAIYPPIRNDQTQGAGIIMLTEQNDDVFVVLVKCKNRETLSIPGGYSNAGESFRDTSIRETMEETCIMVSNIVHIADYMSEELFGGVNMVIENEIILFSHK